MGARRRKEATEKLTHAVKRTNPKVPDWRRRAAKRTGRLILLQLRSVHSMMERFERRTTGGGAMPRGP